MASNSLKNPGKILEFCGCGKVGTLWESLQKKYIKSYIILISGPLYQPYFRVATAQGKQGIWLLTFPDRENTGNLVNLIFYTGKIVPTQGKF